MRFTIRAASSYITDPVQPCKNAILIKSIPPRVGYNKGYNFYEIELNSLDELLALIKEVKSQVIINNGPFNTDNDKLPNIRVCCH